MADITENDDLKSLIEREKRNLADEYFNEIWEAAQEDGIDGNIMAEAFIEGALSKLSEENSVEVSRLIAHFKELDEMGLLRGTRTIQ